MLSRFIAATVVVLALAACNRETPARDGRPGAAVRLTQQVTPLRYDVTITPDAEAMRFRGSVKIAVEVIGEPRRITLNAADLAFDRAVLEDGATARVSLDARRQTASFTFPEPLAPGRHDLLIDYRGKINTSSSGLFAQDYQTADGQARRMLVTQFQNADYRRFAPSWDDPASKAVFQTTVVIPQAQSAVSNMPAASTTPMAGGLKRVAFQPTPKMSSYLNFLGVGDFERVSRKVDGVDVGVVVRRGVADRARFALTAAEEQLRWYNSYFGMPYPLPKLDLIAAPGSGSFGAMENWGAILFFEPYLLVDPALSTEADRQYAYVVISHEIAHQWFGDLVTMRWWDDLWLNESFASWMENKATAAVHPEWNRDLSALADRDKAMRLDAGAGSHPIVQPSETMEQVNQIGDAITYEKGAAVIRMLEAFVGETAFRDGVRAYLTRFAYTNATRDDLWRAIEGAAKKPVLQIARDFTLQAGVPLISVEAGGRGQVALRQGRFGSDEASKSPRVWRVPVVAGFVRGGETSNLIVGDSGGASTLAVEPNRAVVVNWGQTGYYRTLYGQGAFAGLAGEFAEVRAADQLGLIFDTWALGASGYAPVANVLELTARLPEDADPKVWAGALDVLTEIDSLYEPGPTRRAFRAWATERLGPLLERVGWEAAGADGDAILRERLIGLMGRFGAPEVVEEARARFESFRAEPETLTGDLRPIVLELVGLHARPTELEALRGLARRATDPQEKRQFLEALAGVSDPRLARRVLDMAMTTEVPANISGVMFQIVAGQHPDLAFARAVEHQRELNARLDSAQRLSFYPRLFNTAAEVRAADTLRAFAQRAYPAGGRREADKVEAQVRYRAKVRAERLPEIDRWLQLAEAETAKARAETLARERSEAEAEAARQRTRPRARTASRRR